MKTLAIAFILGLVAPVLVGAASQYTYRLRVNPVAVTGARALEYVTMFKADSAWSGSTADMDMCRIRRMLPTQEHPTGIVVECHGRATVPADSLPVGVEVTEVHN